MDIESKPYRMLKGLSESTQIRLVEEPADLAYPATLTPQDGAHKICAVYGTPADIARLKQAGALTTRLGGRHGDTVKAYLNKNLSENFLRDHPSALVQITEDEALLGLAVAEYDDARIALCDDAPNQRSFLILGAGLPSQTKPDSDRLATPYGKLYVPQQEPPRGGHELFAVSPDVAAAVRRAHPDLLDATATLAAQPLSTDTQEAMFQIAARIKHDPALQYVPPEKAAPVVEIKPDSAPAKATLSPQDPEIYTEELRPLLQEMVHAHRFGNQMRTQFCFTDTPRTKELITALASAEKCKAPVQLSYVEQRDGLLVYTVQATREIHRLKKYLSSDLVAHHDAFPAMDMASLSKARHTTYNEGDYLPTGIYAAKRQTREERMTDFVLVQTGNAKKPAYYFAAVGDSAQRCGLFASDIKPTAKEIITKPTAFPAIAVFPVSYGLYRALKDVAGVKVENRRYGTPQAMKSSLERQFGVQDLAAKVISKPVARSQQKSKRAVPPREGAANVLFDTEAGGSHSKIMDMMLLAPPEDFGKRPVWRLGIKVHRQREKNGRKMAYNEFSDALKMTGFVNAEHRLEIVGKEPWDKENSTYCVLELHTKDVNAWRRYLEPLRTKTVPRNERGMALSLMRAQFAPAQPQKVSVQDAPWVKLAQYARAGKFKHIQLHYSAQALEEKRNALKLQRDEIEMIGRHEPQVLDALRRAELTPSPSYIRDVDTVSEDTLRRTREFYKGYASLAQGVAALDRALENFDAWRAEQITAADGSITLDCLVCKEDEAPVTALDELEERRRQRVDKVLARPSAGKAQEQGRTPWNMPEVLFPSPRFQVPGVIAQGDGMVGAAVIPVSPSFISTLARYDAIIATPPAPIKSSALLSSLREIHRKPVVAEKAVSQDDSMKVNARKELLQSKFQACKPTMRYAELQENGMLSPVIHFTLRDRADWTQKVKPLLECMERAQLLAHREDLVSGVVLPSYSEMQKEALARLTVIAPRLETMEVMRQKLGNLEYQHQDGDLRRHFMIEHLRDMQAFDLPVAQTYCTQLSRCIEGGATDNNMSDLEAARKQLLRNMRIEKDGLEDEAIALREEHHISIHDVAYEVSAQKRVATRLINADGEPIEYRDIQSAINATFTREQTHDPIQFIAYLDLLPGGMEAQTTQSDREIAKSLCADRPTVGRWSAREANKVVYPSREALFAGLQQEASRQQGASTHLASMSARAAKPACNRRAS